MNDWGYFAHGSDTEQPGAAGRSAQVGYIGTAYSRIQWARALEAMTWLRQAVAVPRLREAALGRLSGLENPSGMFHQTQLLAIQLILG